MSSRTHLGHFEDVKMEGTNIGATMTARRECSGDSRDCCCINIYISSNIQGVNNSILVGSSLKLRDPGVNFSINGLTFNNTESQQPKKMISDSALASSLVLLSAALIASFLLSLFM